MQHTIVLEIGNAIIRGGFAGECTPRFVFPIFDEFKKYSSESNMVYLYLLEIMTKVFVDFLQVKGKDCRIIIVEKLFETKIFRDSMLTILFRDFQVQAISMQPDAFMTIYATGCISGIVIDIGETESRAIAIYNQIPILKTIQFAKVGVFHAANKFKKDLFEKFNNETINFNNDKIRNLFDKSAYCLNPHLIQQGVRCEALKVGGDTTQGFSIPFEMRQACIMSLILGDASDTDISDECGGLVGLLLNCIRSCNMDIRSAVSKNIIVCGGGSAIPGLPHTLLHEALSRTEADPTCAPLRSVLRTACQPDGQLLPVSLPFPGPSLAFVGASIFGSADLAANNDAKFLKLKDFKGRLPPSPGLLAAPDWLSLDAKMWTFFGPKPVLLS